MIRESERVTAASFADHPFSIWGKALLEDPGSALEDLFSSAGTRGTQQHAEPTDFLADLLAHSTHEDAKERLIDRLDTALLKWLEGRREWAPNRIIEYPTRAYLAEIDDALAVAARLPLKITGRSMIRTHYTWDDWFRGLGLPGDIDLLRQFDMVLIRHQTDGRFMHRWFAACDEAAWGGPYWQTKLRTGLLGLRKVPIAKEVRPEVAVASALVRFSVLALSRETRHALVEATVRRHAGALAVLYPRHPRHWRNVWAEVFDFHRQSGRVNSASLSTVTAWLGNREATDGTPGRDARPPGASGHRAELPLRHRRLQIENEIAITDTLGIELWNRIQGLVDDHWRYALESGDGHYAVRTTVNLCNRALSLDVDRSYVENINCWSVQAIEAEPENPFGWDLWAKALAALGHQEVAAAVRWESIRRFPANVVLHGSLAHLLVTQDKLVLAEALLRETITNFPRNVVIRHILTLMLWKQGRHEEATDEADVLNKLNPLSAEFKRLSDLVRRRRHLSSNDFDGDLAKSYSQRFGDLGNLGYAPVVLRVPHTEAPAFSHDDDAGSVTAYIGDLEYRTRWTELFFAPSASGRASRLNALRQQDRRSELALVAAHRAGLIDEQRAKFLNWADVRPSSYSTRLLLALREHDGLGETAMQKISEDFPQHRRWNRWLCYSFATPEDRNMLRQEAQKATTLDSWIDRLDAVYPRLANGELGEAPSFDQVGQRRLVEEIAFAAAERSVPSLTWTGSADGST